MWRDADAVGRDHGPLHERLLDAAREMFDGGAADDPLRWAATITIAGSACDVAAAHSWRGSEASTRRREPSRLSVSEARKLDRVAEVAQIGQPQAEGSADVVRSLTGDNL